MPTERPSKTHQFKDKERLSRSWCQKVENFISTFRVLSGGQFIFDGRNAVLQIYGNRFSGVVYVAGSRFCDSALTDTTGTQIADNSTDAAKTWIKVDVSSNTVSYEDGPPPIPFPPGVEYYERAKTFGDIHITRF